MKGVESGRRHCTSKHQIKVGCVPLRLDDFTVEEIRSFDDIVHILMPSIEQFPTLRSKSLEGVLDSEVECVLRHLVSFEECW